MRIDARTIRCQLSARHAVLVEVAMTLLRKTAKLPLQVSNQLFDAARRVGIRRDLPASWRYRRIFICS